MTRNQWYQSTLPATIASVRAWLRLPTRAGSGARPSTTSAGRSSRCVCQFPHITSATVRRPRAVQPGPEELLPTLDVYLYYALMLVLPAVVGWSKGFGGHTSKLDAPVPAAGSS